MKKLLFALIRYSGLPFLYREFIQRNKVTIILYHDISKEIAEKSFSYLQKKYNIISLQNFLYACKEGNSSKLPKKALVITFDDGHIQNYDILPIIKKYKIPITIFLCAGIINTKRHYWFMHEGLNGVTEQLKKVPNNKRLSFLSQKGFIQDKEYDIIQALSKEQIMEMKPFVDFQAHTLFHPCLPTCNDNEAQVEIVKSKQVLEEGFNLTINALAYPNGDFTEREIRLSKAAGYVCAVTTEPGFNTIKSDLFRLKRISVNDTNNLHELIVKSSGAWATFKRFGSNE